MDVRVGSVLILTLGAVAPPVNAEDFHESLQGGVICSADGNPVKFEILERPTHADGFFKVSEGLCRALVVDQNETSTLFPVAFCMDAGGAEFTLFFGGWLNMLTVKFKDDPKGDRDLICR